MDPLIPNTIYAGLNNGGVYKSNDGGANWSSYNNGLDAGIDVNDLSFISDRLYATTSKGVYVTDMLPRLQGGESSFYGGLLKEVVSGLVSGAAGKIGGDSMGYILNLLGYGGGGDQQNLDAMSGKLDQIVDYLGNIKSELDDLMNQLKITEEEILKNVNNPKDAINSIASTHEDLQKLSKNSAGSVQPGSETFTDFLNTVENVRDIYQQVDNIKYAIIPLTSANAPVLNNFTKLSIDEGNSLWNIYLGLEQYFSQLVYYQMEGVNLICETKIYRDKAKLAQVRDGFNAQQYLSYGKDGTQYGFIETKLQPEVDNFMDNVYRMIMNQVDLLGSSSFLPPDAPSILSRANFFRIQSLNEDHYGLRGTLIATKDLVSSVITINARNRQTGKTYPGKGTLYTVSNTGTSKYTVQVKTYDYWSGNNVKPSSDYTVIAYDFGGAPLGDYDILDGSGNVIGSAKVQAYKDDYTVDASGTINYGHFTITKRVGARDRFANSEWDLYPYNINCGTITLWKSPFKFQGYGCTGNNARKFRDFIIDSPDPVKFYLSATISGSAVGYYYDCKDTNTGEVCNYTTNTVGYRIKLWDVTTNTGVHQFDSDEKTSIGGNKQVIAKTLKPDYSFPFANPSPGHKYSIYLELYADGEGDSRSNVMISIDPISLGIQY
jgi:hypothetical protein